MTGKKLDDYTDEQLGSMAFENLQKVLPFKCRKMGLVPPFIAVAIASEGVVLVTRQTFKSARVVNNNVLLARLGPSIRLPVTLIVVDQAGRQHIELAKRPDGNVQGDATCGPVLGVPRSEPTKRKLSKSYQ